MHNAPVGDESMTWVYGKVHPGWYVAMTGWIEKYAVELRAMGYTVERSIDKPKQIPQA